MNRYEDYSERDIQALEEENARLGDELYTSEVLTRLLAEEDIGEFEYQSSW
jgi:hypothetical protein